MERERAAKVADAMAALLCGGNSSRMGFDKAFLQLGGASLLWRQAARLGALFPAVALVSEDRRKLEGQNAAEVLLLEDDPPGVGPLGGLCAALRAAEGAWVFVMACDMPGFDEALVRQMAEMRPGRQVVLCESGGREEPLFAFYHKSCLPVFEAQLKEGNRKLRGAFQKLSVERLCVEPARAQRAFANLNTPEQLADFAEKENP